MNPRRGPGERMTLASLGALMEAVRSDVERVAEAVSGLTIRFQAFEKRLVNVEAKLEGMEPIVRTLAKDVKEIKDRLVITEAKLAP